MILIDDIDQQRHSGGSAPQWRQNCLPQNMQRLHCMCVSKRRANNSEEPQLKRTNRRRGHKRWKENRQCAEQSQNKRFSSRETERIETQVIQRKRKSRDKRRTNTQHTNNKQNDGTLGEERGVLTGIQDALQSSLQQNIRQNLLQLLPSLNKPRQQLFLFSTIAAAAAVAVVDVVAVVVSGVGELHPLCLLSFPLSLRVCFLFVCVDWFEDMCVSGGERREAKQKEGAKQKTEAEDRRS